MIYGRVVEVGGQITSVGLCDGSDVMPAEGETVIITILPAEGQEAPTTSAPPTEAAPALQRHQALRDSLMEMFARGEILKSPAVSAIVSMTVCDALAPDIANLPPVIEPVSANENHPLGIVRAIHSQAASEYFHGTQLERQLAATNLLFAALGKVTSPSYEADEILFCLGTAALGEVVQMELEAA